MITSMRLPVAAAAAHTGLSVSTLNKLRVFGGGPVFLKLGRRVAYDVADLDAWLASKRRRSTSDADEAGER
jgi:predicted DNA-binding transcriptional regulator AlpA